MVTDTVLSPGKELTITRVLNAPIELVWKVWTEPDHIKNWWGPNGFTNTIFEMDIRPGGNWDFIMVILPFIVKECGIAVAHMGSTFLDKIWQLQFWSKPESLL